MITRIDGLGSAGGGKITFCVTTDENGADEDIRVLLGGSTWSTHVQTGPGTHCGFTIATGQKGEHSVVLTAQTSGVTSAPWLLDLSSAGDDPTRFP